MGGRAGKGFMTGALLPPVLCLCAWIGAADQPHGNKAVITVSVLSNDPPPCALPLVSSDETGADTVTFQAVFGRPVAPTFTADTVELTGSLSGAVRVGGTDPAYTVLVDLDNPDSDGTVGIRVRGGAVFDREGNVCAAQLSPECHVFNWRGFIEEPADFRAYSGDTLLLRARPDCGAASLSRQWRRNTAQKALENGPASPEWEIPAAVPADSGEYWCEAGYDGRTHHTRRAQVAVAEPLRIARQPQDITATAGGACVLSILAEGGHPPIEYRWMKNGLPIGNADKPALELGPLSATDTGLYAVEVTDSHTGAVLSDSATLTVLPGVPAAHLPGLLLTALVLALLGARTRRRVR
ncbi:MAG: hypothetical protein GX580_00220 [Candidatus Hydrogenedens sp.]|nr:hypothetical protein [Candidatus Hydrogenedentota bacterium]NLF56044.1 hypothetical protein [Candidatus Hydrogenedens sp.]